VGVEGFLSQRWPVFFSYLSFRPEYRLEVVREAMKRFRERYSCAGFIWLGFPDRELSQARAFVNTWTEEERRSLLLVGNLVHDDFLTLLTRCSAYLRSPACDGVAASVLEALALKVPVVASENGRRPAGVITYRDEDATDMCAKMIYVVENDGIIRSHTDGSLTGDDAPDNVACMADWLTQETPSVKSGYRRDSRA
jgi:adenylate kinase family enzyme